MTQRNKNRTGYKKTEIGWIPKEWHCMKLGSEEEPVLQVIRNGLTVKQDRQSGNYKVTRIETISDGEINLSNVQYVTDVPTNIAQAYLIRKGDILFSHINSESHLGKTAIATQNYPDLLHGMNLLLFRVNPNKIAPEFLNFLFIFYRRLGVFRKYSSRAVNQSSLNQEVLKSLIIPLPTLPEQQRIIQILSTWDRAIDRVQRLIEAKQRQKIKLVSQLLSRQKRFPGFQNEWKQVKLGAFLHPKFRKVVKPAGAYLRLGIRSHGKGTFTSVVDDPETIALTHLFQARKDDLIVNITFAWEGAITLVGPDGDGALVSHRFPTYVFDTSKMLPEYFKHLMVTDRFFYELVLISPGGAGRNRVMNKGDFLKIMVTIPGVEEQKKIAGMLGGLDDQIDLLKKYLEKLKEQKKGLMQKLLTGEIRVKVN